MKNIMFDLSAFKTFFGNYWAYCFILVAGVLPTEIWRLVAVFLSGALKETDEVIIWIRHIATALLMAVVAKMVITPSGALAGVSILARGFSFAAATLGFMVLGRSILVAILCGEAVLFMMIFLGL